MAAKKPSAPPVSNQVRIFDTTLRDGEQSPGATLTSAEKLEVARALARLGVDAIEAGFPAASPDDLAAVQSIAQTIGQEARQPEEASAGDTVLRRLPLEPPIICALARATEADIDRAVQAVQPAKHARVHTFLATSAIHREHKLRMSRKQVVERAAAMVAYARRGCADVEFSPEDACRTEPEFLYDVLAAAIEAGAGTLNIPDTVGYATPEEFGALIQGIRQHVRGIEQVVLSVHCHDDLGLATANTLAGLRAGARQAEVTINGIGERAGNTALEEVVMALRTRQALFGLRTAIDTTQLARVSRLVSSRTGMAVQPNKAIVGANAFAHESGIHQDGMLKHQDTYEIMRPETVGVSRTQLVLGKHSGRRALGNRLRELGYSLAEGELNKAFERFKTIADRKKVITDADIEALASSELHQPTEHFALAALQIGAGTLGLATATVRLRAADGSEQTYAAIGTGPVDAVYKAIDHLVGAPSELVEYAVHSVTEGIDALGEVSVRLRAGDIDPRINPQHDVHPSRAHKHRLFHGHGADTDILVASAKAYLAAINRLISAATSNDEAAKAEAV